MSYPAIVKEKVNQYCELEITDTQKNGASKCKDIPEQVYYKSISRMIKTGVSSIIQKSYEIDLLQLLVSGQSVSNNRN